jgi:tRNA-dihydrouridine synthase B
LVLAPLAGISNYPFRQMCRDFGANLTFTEMVSIDGLLYQNEVTKELLTFYPEEKPIGFQLFGSDLKIFEEVMPQIENLKPDVIDINFGCPVHKVTKKGAGAALLNDTQNICNIIRTVKQSTEIPVTAKIRLGWDSDSIVVKEAACAVEDGGADGITVHARTRNQGYSGKAEWEYIAQVKEILSIPVIGNGDVFDGPAALKMFQTTGVDGIMLARGVLGRPWLFKQIIEYLETGKEFVKYSIHERLNYIEKHYQLEIQYYSESVALSRMKKFFVWYTQGLPHIAKLRNQIFRCSTYRQIRDILSSYEYKIREIHQRKQIRIN